MGSQHTVPVCAPDMEKRGTDKVIRDDLSADASLDTVWVDADLKMNVSDDLNAALKWCEEQVAVRADPTINPVDPLDGRTHIRKRPAHLRQMYFLYPDDEAVVTLLSYFTQTPVHYAAGMGCCVRVPPYILARML